ncbi:MAG TPA: YdaU family protein [Frateuria sp.]|uniref:YdaU family protein n=1 Tax=Frateuria sp. TaxID=2211372 RepID=UPI002DF347EC|nr:YdaU family protein [Frateuria sp.]
MNYFEFHIGDYEKGTAHLTACEDGIYGRLIRRYYDTEAPLPLDLKALQRLVRARTRDEKAAVETVLEEFFQQQEDGWHHKRCDEEIARFAEKREKAKRSAEARWSNRAEHTERNANASANAMRTHCDGNALQSPDTSNQDQEQKLSARTQIPQGDGTEAGRACLLLKQAGCARASASHPDLLAALSEGVTPEAIRDTYLEFPDARNPFAYAISTARGRHADGAKPIATGPPRRTNGQQPLGKTAQALHTLEAMKHGSDLDQERNPHGLPEAPHARLGSDTRR